MPVRSLQPCTAAGCPELGSGGRCRAHRRARQAAYNANRGSSTAQGYDADHKRQRARIIEERGYACEDCGVSGHLERIDLDHIDGNNRNRDDANVRLRCILCHSRKTALVDRRWGARR